MKKRVVIIVTSVVIVILGILVFVNFNKDNKKDTLSKEEILNEQVQNEKVINFLSSIAGVEASNIKVIKEPVIGFKGELFAPSESIEQAVEYFLENTENDKMKNLKISIDENAISLTVDYKVMNFLNVPVKVTIEPTLNEDKDLILNIKNVEVLDIKVSKSIVDLILNNFVKDWFPEDESDTVQFNDGYILIDKEAFNGIYLESIYVDSKGIKGEFLIDMAKVSSKN